MAIRYKTLTQKEYDALGTYETDLIYYVADTGKQFLNGVEYPEDADLSKNVVKDYELKGDFGKESNLQIDGKAVVTVSANGKIDPSLVPEVGGTAWGAITGTLADQTDLQTALNGKANTTDIPVQQQVDYEQSDSSAVDYIKNKPIEDNHNYLCLESKSDDGMIRINKKDASMADANIEYSFDKKHWTTYTWNGSATGYEIPVQYGTKVYFRGNNNSFSTGENSYFSFSFGYNKKIKASGDVMSLLSKDLSLKTLLNKNYVFYRLFERGDQLITAPELSATTVSEHCYEYMFWLCWNIQEPPELPAYWLQTACYKNMFTGCYALKKTPVLRATYMANSCYNNMFSNCRAITHVDSWTTNSLESSCFSGMFSGCTSLTNTPTLPITTLKSFCYSAMFRGCTSLTQIPTLPATNLAEYCYSSMFEGCTGLTKAEFSASNVSERECCRAMFSGCSNLKFVKAPFSGTYGWFAFYEFLKDTPAGVLEDAETFNADFLPANWIKVANANIPDTNTTSKIENASTATYCVCPSSKETGVLTVASSLTLDAMPTSITEIAYAEVVLDIVANATVTAGSNITFVDEPTVGKRNVCVVRWSDGTAKLYVTIVEDLDESSSSN